MTYLILNLIVITIVMLTIAIMRQTKILHTKSVLGTLLILTVLTALFDSVIIDLGLVTYDSAKILDVYVFKAPIEDFAYTLVVAMIVPVIWTVSGRSDHEKNME